MISTRDLQNLWWTIPVLMIVVSTFPKHLDEFYLYVPTGLYIQYLEYLILVSLPLVTWYFYKKKLKEQETKGFWKKVLSKAPAVYFIFSFIFNFFVGVFIVYTFGLFMDYLPQDYKYNTYNVEISKIEQNVKRYCKPALKTDILDQVYIENKSLFHRFIQKFNKHKICTAKSNSTQYFRVGAEINLFVKESEWGIYVYGIP